MGVKPTGGGEGNRCKSETQRKRWDWERKLTEKEEQGKSRDNRLKIDFHEVPSNSVLFWFFNFVARRR